MNRGFLIIVLFLAIGLGMYHYLQPQGSGTPEGILYDIVIQNQSMDPSLIKVGQGTQLTLEFRTDVDGTVTVAEHDASAVVATGRVVTMNLFAGKPGTFAFMMREDGAAKAVRIGTLEVVAPRKGW